MVKLAGRLWDTTGSWILASRLVEREALRMVLLGL